MQVGEEKSAADPRPEPGENAVTQRRPSGRENQAIICGNHEQQQQQQPPPPSPRISIPGRPDPVRRPQFAHVRSFVRSRNQKPSFLSLAVSQCKLCDPLSNQVRITKIQTLSRNNPSPCSVLDGFVSRTRREVRFGSTRILAAVSQLFFSLGRKLHKNTRTHSVTHVSIVQKEDL